MSYRIIVTGCRDWEDAEEVSLVLGAYMIARRNFAIRNETKLDLVIVHGACPTGADALAAQWCVDCEVEQERHQADWSKHSKAAGPIRNEEMAELGAELCVAFWGATSRGTLDMIIRATKHGIPVRIIPMPRPLRGQLTAGAKT